MPPRAGNFRPGGRRRGPSRGGSRNGGGGRRPLQAVLERPTDTPVDIPKSISVKDLADLLKVNPVEVIKELMKLELMANVNQIVDHDTASTVATELGYQVSEAEAEVEAEAEPTRIVIEDEAEHLKPRPPVITIMGHVDHGKTSLLDAIRQTNVAAGEAGGITQHIGAYQAEVNGQRITFLDTPGHAAFTAMRARGAQATDIAVLVVAADDGVMPQTKEAIDHARAANVPIVVALNKIDRENANPDRVKQELADNGLVIEEWGGDVVCVPVSARQKIGIEDLLENLLLVAEIQELKANPDRPGAGVVIEAKLDKSRGIVATLLVQNGTLNRGDTIVAGESYGRLRAMFNFQGKPVKKAGPSVPVEVLGLSSVPVAGDLFVTVADEKAARVIVTERLNARQRAEGTTRNVALDDLYSEIQAGNVKELNVILKTDVQGSIEPIKTQLERLAGEGVKVRVIHTGAGAITESDVQLAVASKAIIIGFNTQPEGMAHRLAEQEKVEIRQYSVIYKITEDIESALAGMLEPKYHEVVEGHAEVRQVFKIGRREQIAGCAVTDGKVTRNATVRIEREGKTIFTGKLASLRRFKDDVREVLQGFECGIGVEDFADFQEGDILEFYVRERIT